LLLRLQLKQQDQRTVIGQVGLLPGGRCDTQASRIIKDYHKTKHFRWWNAFDDMSRMDRWMDR